ncbi:MAG: NifB/NifX family molybdenum-iron cluster-binding protein [Leptolyngbyaceae cyanobacterium]
MTEKLLAVAVTQDGTLAAHAGRALRWQVYVVPEAADISLAWTLDLTKTGCLHEWHVRGEGDRHPLHLVDIAIAASAGEGVRRRLQARHTELLTTSEPDPETAIKAYRVGNLPADLPHETPVCHSS